VTKLKITRRLRRWQRDMLLGGWKIKIIFDPPPDEDGDDSRAGCVANPEYKEATIYWDSARVEVDTDAELDDWCIHELLHCSTWRLEKLAERSAGTDEDKYADVRDVAEATVTDIQDIIKAVYQAGWRAATKRR
jgi:hypothetical protein